MADQLSLLGAADVPVEPTATMQRGALISPCGAYRYRLWRRWAPGPRIAVWVMLNPSTADGEQDDATIRRCIAFSRAQACDALDVVNLFALRSTDPKALYDATAPVGPENDDAIAGAVRAAAVVIVAWGNHGTLRGRGDIVLRQLRAAGAQPLCFGLTKLGQPLHPLYQPAAAPLIAAPEGNG